LYRVYIRELDGELYTGLSILYIKNEINEMIRRKLIKAERSPKSIKKWYEYTTNLDRY